MTIISLSLTLHLSFYFSLTIAIFTFSYSGLDLTEYVHCSDDAQPVYDLYAISNHFGGMGGGHCELVTQTPQISEISFLFLSLSFFSLSPPSPSLYLPPPPPPPLSLTLSLSTDTAFAKNHETGKWYNFDDSHVSQTTEERLVVGCFVSSWSGVGN